MKISPIPRALFGLLTALLIPCVSQAGDSPAPAGKPNIVFFLVDDLGYGDVGFNGSTEMRTPQIDRLAKEGAVLEAHYAQAFCSPTRACLLTGRYPTRTGVYRIFMQPAEGGLPRTERTLADALRAAGYQTAICGKWHLGEFDPAYLPMARGFDRQYGHYASAINYFTHMAGLRHDWYRDGREVRVEGYATDLLAAEACRIVAERDAARPFFLYVPFNAVHAPLHVPNEYVLPFTNLKGPRRALAGMQAAVDKGIGQVVSALEVAGIRDNTLIVFSSDNGGIWPGTNGPLRDFKGSLYEGGIRACAFANWPGRIPPAQRIKEPMHVVDWYPTLVKLAGGARADSPPLDGRDVWPMLTQSAPSPHEEILVAAGPDDAALRVGDWKLTHGRRSKKPELYHLAADIGETRDLAATEPERLRQMQARLARALSGAVPLVSEPTRAADTKKRRPNVVLILVDDQGYGDLSCHGNPLLQTPNMDALWAQGVRLTNFHVSPLCSPTRAALMTGRHCRKVGVHGTNGTDQHLVAEAVTMAALFSANGYATGVFGKWHLGDRYPLRPMDRGFAESVVFPDGAVSTIPDYWGNDYFDDTYWRNGAPQAYQGYCTDVWFDLALKYIETNKERPFLCYLPTNAAHAPYLVPERYAEPYRSNPGAPAAFYGMIANLDENLGRLRKRLSEMGIDKNTILIFMTDNGTAAGAFNAGMRGKKGSPYDGGHRVPCFVYYPEGGLQGGRDVAQLSAHIDILPTLVDLCRLAGKPATTALDGISLEPWLLRDGRDVEDRVLIESFRGVVMTSRWRLVSGQELYDIHDDPAQQRNVAAKHPDVVARLARELEEHRKTEDHRPHHVVIGSDRQNPVTLTGEDWQARPLIYQNWMARVPRHNAATNRWNVEVAQAGRYRFALRRWPKETETPINAVLPKEKWSHGMLACEALHAVEARIRVNQVEFHQPVTDAMQKAEFRLDLSAGDTAVEAWFVDNQKQSRSACYLEAERLPAP